MNRIASRPRSAAVLLTALALAVGCDDKEKAPPAKDDKAKADKPTVKEAKAKSADAKDGKAVAKADDEAPKDADAKADDKADGGGGRQFRKGQVAPVGMTDEEVYAYNEAQGDPIEGKFELAAAFEGDDKLADPKNGTLSAVIHTTMGDIVCKLYEKEAPLTVASFVGLARGTRPSYDKKGDVWEKKKFFEGIVFHRVIDGFMIQTGDPTGSGTGGSGYVIVDEIDKGLKHNTPGLLSMANRGPNTGNSQFFVTVAKTPHLDGKHAIFGKCDTKVAIEISKVKTNPANDRPYEPVSIKSIDISRQK
ncbi:MAG TPA: peptidylprolyl isomerase [Nannocystaceae bacterium]|nr:peptidylprolyl isomerase [Nannocystaceae bacterium]